MILQIYDNKKNLVNTIKEDKIIKNKLIELLWSKYIAKSRNIKRVEYDYNYTDMQDIRFILSNGYMIRIYYIPTTQRINRGI